MKIFKKSMKKKVKEMRESILERMGIEQQFQADLRITLKTSTDDEEIKKAKALFDESVKYWEVLNKSLIEYDKQLSQTKWKISLDTLMTVLGNLAGILLILNFEKMDIIRSKAISFVMKGKL